MLLLCELVSIFSVHSDSNGFGLSRKRNWALFNRTSGHSSLLELPAEPFCGRPKVEQYTWRQAGHERANAYLENEYLMKTGNWDAVLGGTKNYRTTLILSIHYKDLVIRYISFLEQIQVWSPVADSCFSWITSFLCIAFPRAGLDVNLMSRWKRVSWSFACTLSTRAVFSKQLHGIWFLGLLIWVH